MLISRIVQERCDLFMTTTAWHSSNHYPYFKVIKSSYYQNIILASVFFNFGHNLSLIYRVVKLHSKPSGMCFSTEKGDLLIAIGEHVHKIPYEKCKCIDNTYCCTSGCKNSS